MTDIVPRNLGFWHEVITNHTRPIARTLFSNGLAESPEALTVLDRTYIYIQKSCNFSFSSRSYTDFTNTPLMKLMTVVTTADYIFFHSRALSGGFKEQ